MTVRCHWTLRFVRGRDENWLSIRTLLSFTTIPARYRSTQKYMSHIQFLCLMINNYHSYLKRVTKQATTTSTFYQSSTLMLECGTLNTWWWTQNNIQHSALSFQHSAFKLQHLNIEQHWTLNIEHWTLNSTLLNFGWWTLSVEWWTLNINFQLSALGARELASWYQLGIEHWTLNNIQYNF